MRRSGLLLVGAVLLGCNGSEPSGSGDTAENVGEGQLAAESLQTPSRPNAIRFLEQATFGPTLQDLAHVQAVGISAAITEQLGYAPGVYTGWNANNNLNPPLVARDPAADIFEHAIAGQDQLRQRVALALSQIFVVSLTTIGDNGAVADYLSMLREDAFGSFEALLKDVTLHPVMGRYLNLGNNVAFSSVGPSYPLIKPDENYAREVMQLFTVGLDKLNLDGTPQLDCNGDSVADAGCTVAGGGKRIATYSQDTVENLAHTLTGWHYDNVGASTCPAKGAKKNVYYGNPVEPLIACPLNHDGTAKLLLHGFTTTANATPEQHLTEALHNLVTDPSTAPFISKQLIQHLVTANPSPAYVQRVATKFVNTAGNLGSVVRAILEDDEARGPVPPAAVQAQFGHLRSPILHITNPIRWLGGTIGVGTGPALNGWSGKMGQSFPRPPSVFSYYPPNYPLPGSATLLGPELAIVNGGTSMERGNYLTALLFPFVTKNATLTPITGITLDMSIVPQDIGPMVDWIDTYIMHGTMTATTKSLVLDAVSDVPQGSQKALALYLTFSSPEYQVER